MAGKNGVRRAKYRVALKLDLEWDADLVAWLQAIPEGQRSSAIREAVRRGLIVEKQATAPVDLEAMRQVISHELSRALAHLKVADRPAAVDQDDIEARYGAKLDRMLGGLQRGETHEE
jgi:hypothetical protein